MATEREFEGASEDEALQAAAAALGTAVTQLDYTLIDEGAEGVFGLGARPVRIRVRLSEEPAPRGGEAEEEDAENEGTARMGLAPEKAARARTVTVDLLERLGVKALVSVEDEEENIVVRVEDEEGSSEVSELFSRARPPLAPSFQFLLNKIVNRFPEDRKHVVVEAAGAKARAEAGARSPRKEGEEAFDPELVALAEQLGEKAKATGKVITVHPMLSGDRRAVHQTLMRVEGVKTVSSGEGLYRQMHIVASGRSDEGDRGRRRRRRTGRRSGEA